LFEGRVNPAASQAQGRQQRARQPVWMVMLAF
jgi:hypothetical protein